MRPLPLRTPSSPRSQRGVANPSPLVMLSVTAVAMAGVAFFATRDVAPTERAIPVATSPSATPASTPTVAPAAKPVKRKKPAVQRGKVYVEVYNNSGITGLAGTVGNRAAGIGWQVVGSDNWYGTIPASTVYYPARLEAAGKLLALDLGIARTKPAVDPMRQDRLTVVLTADAAG